MDDIIAAYKNDLEQSIEYRSFLDSEKHKKDVMKEVSEKKDQMSVTGKPIEERVKEFASLNYLLSYKFADRPADGSIPKAGKTTGDRSQTTEPTSDDELALRIRIAEAEMELLNLSF
jgi:hypothetical protein